MSIRTLLVLVAATIVCEGVALAQSNAGTELTTISYPVAELVYQVSASRQAEKIATCENELMAHLCKKVAPATWDRAGGQGTMQYDRNGYFLHVRQTPRVHAELKLFLAQLLREQVSVEVRIVSVSEKMMEGLERSGFHWTKKDGIESAMLDELKLFRFLESAQGDRAAHILQFPKITMFDGQDATTSSGTWTAVQGIDFQEKDGKPAATPIHDKVFLGIQARLLPTISTDRRNVTVQAEISQKTLREPVIVEGKTPNQQPAFNELKLAVVAKVPDQRTVAILAGTVLVEMRTETTPTSTLSRIPYVSRLVRNVGWSRETVRQIVLLTPRIVRDEEIVDVQPLRTKIQAEDNGKFPLILP